MQGVQANANAVPTRKAPSGPAGFRLVWIRLSLSSRRIRNTPIMCRPKIDQQRAGDLRDDRRVVRDELADAPSPTRP